MLMNCFVIALILSEKKLGDRDRFFENKCRVRVGIAVSFDVGRGGDCDGDGDRGGDEDGETDSGVNVRVGQL